MSRWSVAFSLSLTLVCPVLAVSLLAQRSAAQQPAAEFQVGDQVELTWAGEPVTGEVLERTRTGWFKVRFTWQGREMTPTLPPDNLRPAAGDGAAEAAVTAANNAPVRTWKDASGKFEIQAAFAGQDAAGVRLKKADGKTIRVPLDKLSQADQQYVQELLKPAADAPADKPADPANPFEGAEVIGAAKLPAKLPARRTARAAPAKQEYDREADYSAVRGVVLQPEGKGFVPDAAVPLDMDPADRTAALGAAGGHDRFFEGPRGILIAREKGEAVLAAVNSPPGGERRVRLLRCDLATMQPAGEIEAPSLATPVDISPSGQLLACLPDWTARRHGEPEMIEIVKLDDDLAPVRRWNMGERSQGDKRFDHLYFLGEDKLLSTSAWGSIVLWDIDQARALWQLKLQSHYQPALSAGRKQIAVKIDRTIGVFDTLTGDTLARFDAQTEPTGVLSFSADGTRLAALSSRVLHVWDIASGRLVGEVWFPKQMWARSLDWCGGDYVLVDRGFLVDLAKRVVVWEYDLPTGKPDAIARMEGGKYWVAGGSGSSGYQLSALTVPDPLAAAKGNSLRADQVLAVKPGAPVSIKINLPGATAEEVQKVTKVLIDEVKRVGLVLTPNAPLVIECSIADAGEEKATYERFGAGFGPPFGPAIPPLPIGPRFGPRFGPFARSEPGEGATIQKRLSVLAVKENGQELWVASGHFGAPFQITIKDGQSVQDAVNEQKGNPVQFFLTAKLPRYLARHPEDAAYGKSKLGQ